MNQNPFLELLEELRNLSKENEICVLLISQETSDKICTQICNKQRGIFYPLDNDELSFTGLGIHIKSEAFLKLQQKDHKRYLLSTFKLYQFTYRTTVEFRYHDPKYGNRKNCFDAIIDNQLTGTKVKVAKVI